MQQRLIDGNALENIFCKNAERYPIGEIQRMLYSGANFTKLMPTIDAVPVVRCGECKWFGTSNLGGGWCNEVMARPMSYDDFCSYGERKQDEILD